jgi:hypothetical protein
MIDVPFDASNEGSFLSLILPPLVSTAGNGDVVLNLVTDTR